MAPIIVHRGGRLRHKKKNNGAINKKKLFRNPPRDRSGKKLKNRRPGGSVVSGGRNVAFGSSGKRKKIEQRGVKPQLISQERRKSRESGRENGPPLFEKLTIPVNVKKG